MNTESNYWTMTVNVGKCQKGLHEFPRLTRGSLITKEVIGIGKRKKCETKWFIKNRCEIMLWEHMQIKCSWHVQSLQVESLHYNQARRYTCK